MQGQASSPQIKRADPVDRKKRLEFSVLHTYLPIASSSLVTSPELAVQDPSCREGTADPLRPVPSVRVHRSRRSRKEPIWKADRIASRPQRITPFTARRTRSVSGSDLVSSDWACWRWVSRYCLTVFHHPRRGSPAWWEAAQLRRFRGAAARRRSPASAPPTKRLARTTIGAAAGMPRYKEALCCFRPTIHRALLSPIGDRSLVDRVDDLDGRRHDVVKRVRRCRRASRAACGRRTKSQSLVVTLAIAGPAGVAGGPLYPNATASYATMA